MSEGQATRFVRRYGRVQRRPAVVKILEDVFKMEAYLRRNSIFVPTSIRFLWIGGELQWARPRDGAEFEILVKGFKRQARPLKMCNSTVVVQAGRLLPELLKAITAAPAAT